MGVSDETATLAELWGLEPGTEFRVHILDNHDDPKVGSIVPSVLTFEQYSEFLRRAGFPEDSVAILTSWEKLPRVDIVAE